MRTLVTVVMSMTTLFSSFGFSDPDARAEETLPPTKSEEERSLAEDGVVYAIDGVGGVGYFPRNLEQALEESGVPYPVRQHYWSHGIGRWYKDLTNEARVQQYGESLADAIIGYKTRNPDKPVFIVARSGGTAVALEALRHLPDNSVERVILLSSGLSPDYDMRDALGAVRTEIVSFWSKRDGLVLGLGTRMFGTLDRVHTDAAGRVGFSVPEDLPDEEAELYEKLVEVEWEAPMKATGNHGTHVGSAAPAFLREYVTPYLEIACD